MIGFVLLLLLLAIGRGRRRLELLSLVLVVALALALGPQPLGDLTSSRARASCRRAVGTARLRRVTSLDGSTRQG